MLRMFAATLAALAIFAGGMFGEEIKGKVKSVDAEKGTITVTVGDKDQEFKISNETKIVNAAGRDVPNGLKAPMFQRQNLPITITTEKKDDKEIVKEVKVGPAIAIRPIQPGQVKPIPIKPIQIKPIQGKPVPVQPKPMPQPVPAQDK